MNRLNPQVPFVWPEPRVIEMGCSYDRWPPFSKLAAESGSIFGIVSALTSNGVRVLDSWIESNPKLAVALVVVVYPACATCEEDLLALLDLAQREPGRISVHVYPLDSVTDRATNALCFVAPDPGTVHIAAGPSEDLGLSCQQCGHANFVFRADPALTESFKRYFDWLWANSPEITARSVALIPNLVLPTGTDEGRRLWLEYMGNCAAVRCEGTQPGMVASVDPKTGDVTILSQSGEKLIPPTEAHGLPKLDPLAERMSRLYEKGTLVSIDKLSRIPPLDAPLDPKLFGDTHELNRGNVSRKVTMRVSIIDEDTLKGIEKRRKSMRSMLTKFTFGLADNMRWMPRPVVSLFAAEIGRVNDEGRELISKLLNGNTKAFIESKRDDLVRDMNQMYSELGREGQVSDADVKRVIADLEDRLTKASSANFTPQISHSRITFECTESDLVSPWGQAFSLLSDLVAFPREALTDSFFFRGIHTPEDDLVDAMNVADDALCLDMHNRGIRGRCKDELALLARIESASLEPRDRCELAWQILDGHPVSDVEERILKMEAAYTEKDSAPKGITGSRAPKPGGSRQISLGFESSDDGRRS